MSRSTRLAGPHGGYGWKPSPPDQRDFKLVPKFTVGLPPIVSLRPNCPPIYDQGNLGSCTANGIAALHQFDQMKKHPITHASWTPSRLFIYYNERVIEDSVDYDSGAYIRDGMKSLAKQGVCRETEWPYAISKFAAKPTARCYRDAMAHQAVLYQAVSQTNVGIRSAVATGMPVVFGFTVYESFESDEVAITGTVPMPSRTEGVLGGHCVVIIGYDDTRQRYECRNSWGTEWADGGYFTMPYAYVESADLCDDFWVLQTIE
jgi:C1A family cysteine protease